MSDLPLHIARELDTFGVRVTATPKRPEDLPPVQEVDQWWKRGEECPH
jgi:hypothetical protein